MALRPPKLRARLFGFLNFLGEGEVIGRSLLSDGRTGFKPAIFMFLNASRPNELPENDESGTSVMGDSGEEEGEGSESETESIVDMVVVGEESVESDVWVDVLSQCWCPCMSYTDMNEGIWFSYILGPGADGILEDNFLLGIRYPEPCAVYPSSRSRAFLS